METCGKTVRGDEMKVCWTCGKKHTEPGLFCKECKRK